jgi:fatty acid desaturase
MSAPPPAAAVHSRVAEASPSGESARFVRQAHAIVRDLMRPRPLRYWADFTVTIAVAYVAFATYLRASPFSLLQGAAFVVCGLAMYRAVVFTHEITHHRGASFAAFTFAWNVLCGVPLMMPSFMYGNHNGHHTSEAYGTWSDPEYILHSPEWRFKVTVFLLLPVVYPILVVLRFLVFTPLTLLSTRMNRFVWTHGSSLYVMNESYRREYDAAAETRSRWVQECACWLLTWSIAGLTLAGKINWTTVGKAYLVFFFWMAINQVRTLAAHRYRNDANEPVTYLDQLLDTNTFPRGVWLPELWAPVGLRYHALHHLLPVMPYHSMPAAHRRLMERLPADSPYHQTVRPGLWPVLSALLRDREYATRPTKPNAASLADRQGAR